MPTLSKLDRLSLGAPWKLMGAYSGNRKLCANSFHIRYRSSWRRTLACSRSLPRHWKIPSYLSTSTALWRTSLQSSGPPSRLRYVTYTEITDIVTSHSTPSNLDHDRHQHADAHIPPCKVACASRILWGDYEPVGTICILGKSKLSICAVTHSYVACELGDIQRTREQVNGRQSCDIEGQRKESISGWGQYWLWMFYWWGRCRSAWCQEREREVPILEPDELLGIRWYFTCGSLQPRAR